VLVAGCAREPQPGFGAGWLAEVELVFGGLSRPGSGDVSAVEPFFPAAIDGKRDGAVDLADVEVQAELRRRRASDG
jgi:hypothetical protein